MASLLLRRRRTLALQALILRIAKQQTVVAAPGFATIDGEMIPYNAGAAAIRNGTAVLVGGLLVGAVSWQDIN
jgi:hypothetical protein